MSCRSGRAKGDSPNLTTVPPARHGNVAQGRRAPEDPHEAAVGRAGDEPLASRRPVDGHVRPAVPVAVGGDWPVAERRCAPGDPHQGAVGRAANEPLGSWVPEAAMAPGIESLRTSTAGLPHGVEPATKTPPVNAGS